MTLIARDITGVDLKFNPSLAGWIYWFVKARWKVIFVQIPSNTDLHKVEGM